MYLALLGLTSQLIGMCLPRGWFKHGSFPYRSFGWEKGGKVYDKLKIKKWKTKVPDASRIVKSMMPKQIQTRPALEQTERMIAETCVAESVHFALMIFGFGCVFVWHGVGGVTVSVLYALGNVPFILIQRYNRPRQAALAENLRIKETMKANNGGSYESAQ